MQNVDVTPVAPIVAATATEYIILLAKPDVVVSNITVSEGDVWLFRPNFNQVSTGSNSLNLGTVWVNMCTEGLGKMRENSIYRVMRCHNFSNYL